MLTRSNLFVLIGLLIVHVFVFSKEAQAYDQGLLFSITKDQYPTSFVFGTIHSGEPEILQLAEGVYASLDQSDQYVMEVVLDGGTMLSSIANLWLIDGRQLSDLIGETLYNQVLVTAQQAGIPEATFTYMKPWVVMMMFSLPPGNYENILDISLMKRALERKMKVLGLETVQEQFDVFELLSLDDQKKLLESALKNYPQLSKQYERLFQAYLDEDLARLQQIGQEQMQQGEEQLVERLLDRLVDQRNQKMVDRLIPLLSQGKSFVAVGALHLPGENGILQLLQQRGFKISRIEF